jgi:hypothetical protein
VQAVQAVQAGRAGWPCRLAVQAGRAGWPCRLAVQAVQAVQAALPCRPRSSAAIPLPEVRLIQLPQRED